MSHSVDRRHFLGTALTTGLAVGLGARPALAAADRLNVGVMGVGGRGKSLAQTFAKQPNVTVTHVCDPDRKRVGQAVFETAKGQTAPPKGVEDFRRILDDKSVDVLVVAACNHWHAPATILACAAGKHVYVEKPCSHNPREGEQMVAAARKHDRKVQMGNQRRTWPKVVEAIEKVRSGAIGRAYFAQAWYHADRATLGRGSEAPVPEGLNFELWQGPAARRPYRTNILHYNWHWFWNWGNGELGNNGVHMIDLCRWGLGVDYPVRVTSAGGRYRFDDDQETPDTHLVSFEFADRRSIAWEGLSCSRIPGHKADVLFHGDKGTLAIDDGGYTVYDPAGKPVESQRGAAGDVSHVVNFLAAVRGEGKLNSEIEEGHKSTLLCHLGNIAHRTGRALRCDPATGQVQGDKDAQALWTREYAPGWEPRV
jgi:predicted dehydrogenase